MLQTIFLNVSVLVFYVFVVQFLIRNKEKSLIFKLLLTMTTSFVALELHILSVSVDELQMLSLAPLVFLLSSLFIGRTISLFSTFLLLGLHLLMLVDLLNGMIILFSSLVPSLLLQYVRSKKIVFHLSILSTWLFSIASSYLASTQQITSLIYFSMIFLTIGYILFFVSETHIKTLVDLERKEAESVTDHLTGLQNRRSLDRMICQIIEDIQNGDETMYSVILFDVDYFKQFNDTYGHISGDEILWQMSRLVENHLEEQEHITLYRYGGEEFCIVMKSVPHKEAKRVGEKIRKLVETANFYIPAKKEIHLTISLGVASYPETTDELSDVLSFADNFLYRAKRNGRNCSFGEQEEELIYV